MEYFKAQALTVALHPRNPATTSNERCSDCAHWQPNGAEASHAPCEVIPGECAHDFWCDYWKQLAPDVTAEKLAAAISAGSESNKEAKMSAMAALPKDSPIMRAWDAYKASPDYANSLKWAAHDEYRVGSMWAAFLQGWTLATERAASLHESVNPASDEERGNSVPGAGAMGAVIEYRDAIRS